MMSTGIESEIGQRLRDAQHARERRYRTSAALGNPNDRYRGESVTIGIAVIGAGMAGRAHAAAYRIAPTLYQSTLPPLRYVSIGDVNPEFGSLAARRFGYERSDTSWQAI